MTKIFDALTPEAQEELVHDHGIELLTVIVRAIPDPDRPDDRLTMKIAAEVTTWKTTARWRAPSLRLTKSKI